MPRPSSLGCSNHDTQRTYRLAGGVDAIGVSPQGRAQPSVLVQPRLADALDVTSYAATVGKSGWANFVGLTLVVGLAGACMGSTESTNDLQQSATAPPLTAQEGCEAGADRVVDRLEEFLAELPDISAQDFLGLEEIDGLTSFQNDVAATIADTTNQSSTLCDLDGFQALVAERINDVERNGVLPEFLIATIRDGRELTTADLAVSPGDDVEAVLGLLDNGSTLTFAPGTYELARPLLLTRSVTIIGAGVDETIISSTSADAAIVIVGQGELIMRDVRVEHVGDAVASVILSFNRPLDVADVHLSGGIADEDGGQEIDWS